MQVLPYTQKPNSSSLAILLTLSILLLSIISPSSSSGPLNRPPPPPAAAADPMLTFFMTDIAQSGPRGPPPPPSGTAPFTTRNGVPSSYLPFLNPIQTLQPGEVTAINQEFKGIKVEGIYVRSLESDNYSKSYIVAMKATWPKLIGGGLEDSLRLFGVQRIDDSESHIAVVGGAGKYRGANGIAVIKAIDGGENDGGEGLNKVVRVTVYLK